MRMILILYVQILILKVCGCILNRIVYSLPYCEGSQSDILLDSNQKNNNEKPVIKLMPETQCHCCAEDLKTAHSGREYKCSHCDLSFKKKASLDRHDIVIHWKCESCTCNECGSSFCDKKALSSVVTRHTKIVKFSSMFICNNLLYLNSVNYCSPYLRRVQHYIDLNHFNMNIKIF